MLSHSSHSAPNHLIIASRQSRLALWQAEHVRTQLQICYPACKIDILGLTTRGDQILDQSLSKIGGKGLFIKELELALADGRADLAVHSLKDVPMNLPSDFHLAAILERDDPRDAFVSSAYANLAALPEKSIVGTSSLRREMLLRHRFAHLDVRPLRGNLDTRLSKLDQNNYAAIILAAAGLKRLGLASRIRTVLSPEDFLPAAGQGALAVEIATHRTDLLAWLKPLHHLPTALSISAERALARALGGSCQLPLAAYADWPEEIEYNLETLNNPATSQIPHQKTPQRLLRIRAVLGLPNGRKYLQAQAQDSVNTTLAAIALGEKLAQNLFAQGAEKILAAL